MFCDELMSIIIGDSRSHKGPKPTREIKIVQKWLRTTFGQQFSDLGDKLKHGRQEDTFSCGVATSNTIAHNILNEPLFHHADRRVLRMRLFIRLAKAQLTKVR